MKGTIITIGDEILIGQIMDTNSAWLGNELALLGVEVVQMITIADKQLAIHQALDLALAQSDLVVITGGLGPTKDDITKKALAEYVGTELELDEELVTRIKGYFTSRNIPFLKAHHEQCLMPRSAKSLNNQLGTAPGMLFEKNGQYLLSMPGVPYEMKDIFSNSFMPEFNKLNKTNYRIYHRTIKTVGQGETRIAEKIEDIVSHLPKDISMSYLPSLGEVKLRLTARSSEDLSSTVDELTTQIIARVPDLVYGTDKINLSTALRNLMCDRGLTLSTAESCTGGYLAHQLTTVPGSSGYYMGSIIAYDYKPKQALLNVSAQTLQEHGAVSEETVIEMLSGVLDKFQTSLGVAISGIAGPGGGLPDKPVGTIWMAWGTKEDVQTYKLTLSKDRAKNIEYTATAAMNALRKFILKLS